MKRPILPPYEPTEEDYRARLELQKALGESQGIPDEDRWSLLFESFSDWWLCYVLRSRPMEQHLIMGRLMPLALFLVTYLSCQGYSDEEKPGVYMSTLQHLVLSAAAEMERRNLHYCVSVAAIPNPYVYFGEPESIYELKDPETFQLEELLDYYTNFCDAAE